MRSDRQRLGDIVVASDAIAAHLARGAIDDGLVCDDTDHSIVAATIDDDLPPLVAAVRRLLQHPDLPASPSRPHWGGGSVPERR